MRFVFRRRIRHPLHPALNAAPAAAAKGVSPALYGAFEDLASSNGARAECAIFPVLTPDRPFLADSQRDLLWEKFRAPVYSLVVDRNEVVGFECEAQHGLHVLENYAPLLPGRLDSAPCECGRPGPRLLPQAVPDQSREIAAPADTGYFRP